MLDIDWRLIIAHMALAELVKVRRNYTKNRPMCVEYCRTAQQAMTTANGAAALSMLTPIINWDTISHEHARKLIHRAFARTRAGINRLEQEHARQKQVDGIKGLHP